MANNTPADHQQRLAALDPSRSFAVAAPAGSGKTGLLTQRVLTLLATCQHPEEVLAITFTRKAAAEMRHRIIGALKDAQSNPEPEEEFKKQTWQLARKVLERDAEQNWKLLSAPNRLRLQTIDGLCRDLARQLVLENGLGELPQPAENAEPFYREAVQELMAELESDSSNADAISDLLRHLDNNMQRLENLLSGLLAKREQWLGHILSAIDARPYLEAQLQQTISDTLQNAYQQLQPYNSDLALLIDFAASNLVDSNSDHPLCQLQGITELPPADSDCGYIWNIVVDLLLTKDGNWRKTINVRDGFPAGKGEPKERKDQLLALIGELKQNSVLLDNLLAIRSLPYPEYPAKQWQVLSALTQLLPQLSARLSLVFLRNNVCDFTEVTLAALRALGDADAPTDTALRLDYRIRHILIDEFQDTSSSQFQLLKKLTTGWQTDDGRTLFIVGDGMQSLYGFRSANVGLFLEARRHPIGEIQLQPLDLTVNFRSQNQVVEWVNQHFKAAFPSRDDIDRGAVRYTDAIAFNDALPGDAVTIDAVVDPENRQQEASLVVEKIYQAKAQNPDGSIAVLVRNRGHLREILPALYQAGLNWQAIDIEPLSKKMAVIDIHSLLRALRSPADRIAWLSILRAPWCGLDLHDLHTLANTIIDENPVIEGEQYPLLIGQLLHRQQISGLSDSGRTRLNRLCEVLLPAIANKGRKPLRSWVEGIWLALGGAEALLDHNDLQHTRRYFDLLEQHSTSGDIDDWQTFTRAVESLYAAPAANSDPKLQLMTIHKSKGLEFDTVIVPGLDKTGFGSDSEMLLWRERIDAYGETQLLLGPLQASGSDKDPLFEHLKQEAKEKTRLENTRVIYVAATRAIKQLHLIFNVKSAREDSFKAPGADSLLAPLWPVIEPKLLVPTQGCTVHRDTLNLQEQTGPATLSHFARLKDDWQPQPVADKPLLADYRGRAEGYDDESQEPDNAVARHTGTVLHQTLQQIVADGVDSWHAERITKQLPFWHSQLQQLGIQESKTALEQLRTAIEQISNCETGRWLLANSHTDSQCELPLMYVDKLGRQRKAVIDRTFVDENNVRWIIDYKSATPSVDQSLEAFLSEQKEHYQPQLKRYGWIFSQLESRTTKLALYFPLINHLELV